MNRARCRENRILYTAAEFSRLPAVDLGRLRRQLECAGCGSRAFYRGPSRGGRSACFGSNEHRPSCPDAASRSASLHEEDESELSGLEVIRVQSLSVDEPGAEPSQGRMGDGVGLEPGGRSGAAHRSLRTLLRHIVAEPALLYSDTRIEAAGFAALSARDFFVRFEQITERHLDQDRGYWGTVISYGYGSAPRSSGRGSGSGQPQVPTDTGRVDTSWVDAGRDLWLNAGPPNEPSVLVRAEQVQLLAELNMLSSFEDLVGCQVLVLGRCVRSRHGKVYIRPISASHAAFTDGD